MQATSWRILGIAGFQAQMQAISWQRLGITSSKQIKRLVEKRAEASHAQ